VSIKQGRKNSQIEIRYKKKKKREKRKRFIFPENKTGEGQFQYSCKIGFNLWSYDAYSGIALTLPG
jgi:hypothetical protein